MSHDENVYSQLEKLKRENSQLEKEQQHNARVVAIAFAAGFFVATVIMFFVLR